jgi:membrane-associated phospholipid phosphatase
MCINRLVFIVFAYLMAFRVNAQTDSSAFNCTASARDVNSSQLRALLIPVSFIATGAILELSDVKREIQEAMPGTNAKIDDYLQWAPVAIIYSSDLLRIKHKNNVFNQTKYLLFSELATAAVTQVLKKLTHVTRPNGGNLSFPSGHTSNAFAGATVLFHEYKEYNKVVACSGYLFSSATAVLRVTNNRHWVPDVLAGAGIGILIANLVYHWEPLKNWEPCKLSDKVSILPDIDTGNRIYLVNIKFDF